jgi:Bacterial Ig-like domain (group 2)
MKFSPAARTLSVVSTLVFSGLLVTCSAGRALQETSDKTPKLMQVTITPANQTITKGATLQLTATANYDDGTKHALDASVTWQTSQSAVVIVDGQGNVTGVGEGVAQVSAAYQQATGSTSVTVGAAALLSITVSPNQSSLPAGESEQLTATGNFSDGTVQSLTQSATWSSSVSAIASVGPSGAAVANAVGTATISATAGSMSGSASLTVTPAVAVALNVNPATLSLVLESSRQMQAMATMSDGTTQDMTGTVTWSSTPQGIASVSNGGLAIALQVGSTTIQAQGSGFTGSASLVVTPLMLVNYYARSSAVASGIDGTLFITNPGLTSGNLCALVYVFDQRQELNECCGCSVSDGGLRTMSLLLDLTANPLTGIEPNAGEIKVVPSNPGLNQQCDPTSPAPNGVLSGWETNVQGLSTGAYETTETAFDLVPMSSGEEAVMANLCGFLAQLGSGKGVCSCGVGDSGMAKSH